MIPIPNFNWNMHFGFLISMWSIIVYTAQRTKKRKINTVLFGYYHAQQGFNRRQEQRNTHVANVFPELQISLSKQQVSAHAAPSNEGQNVQKDILDD